MGGVLGPVLKKKKQKRERERERERERIRRRRRRRRIRIKKKKKKEDQILGLTPQSVKVHGLGLRAGINTRVTQPNTCPKNRFAWFMT